MTTQEYIKAVEQYENLVYTICHNFTRNHHTAQDLAQETFISAYKHKERCTGEPKNWLAKIAVNKCKDYLKSAYARSVTPCGEDHVFESSQLYGENQSPQNLAEQKEACRGLQDNITGLSKTYANVAALYFINEYTTAEIAQILNRPQRTVNTQLYRAKALLRAGLQNMQMAQCPS